MFGPSTGHQIVLSSVKTSTLCVAGSCVHYGESLPCIHSGSGHWAFRKGKAVFLTANCSRDELCLFVVNPIAFSSLSQRIT